MGALTPALIATGAGLLMVLGLFWLAAWVACKLHDAADQALHDLTNADRIWRESTALKAINTEGRN